MIQLQFKLFDAMPSLKSSEVQIDVGQSPSIGRAEEVSFWFWAKDSLVDGILDIDWLIDWI